VLSVTTEIAAYSQQAFLRARDSTNTSTGFSSLVDSNTDAASANLDESPRQPIDQAASSRGDDSNSADAANAKDNTPRARGETKTASTNSDGNAKAADTTDQQQQPADTSATADPETSTAAAQTKSAGVQGVSSQGDGKGRATTKSATTDDSSGATTAQSTPIDQATTLVVAVVAEVTSPATGSPSIDASQTAVTATTAASSVPGAIAAAAASKVAADVAAAESAAAAHSDVSVAKGQPADAKTAEAAKAQIVEAAQQSTPQTGNPAAAQAASTAALPDDTALRAQAVAAQATAPVKVGEPGTSTVKTPKTTSITADGKDAVNNIGQPAVRDPQTAKVTATNDATSAVDPIAQKKPGDNAKAHDASGEIVAKVQAETDPPATPVDQHASIEPRVTQQGTLIPPDLSNSGAAQSAAANVATTPAPTPLAATAIDTSNLTVMTGQAVPLSGLAVEISANAKAGNSRFEIRLDPPDLGRIDVRLDVDKNGQVTSRLFVEKSETLDLLRRDAPQLQQALQDAGLKTSDSGLQFSLRDQNPQQGQGNADGNGNGQNPQRLVIVEDETAAAGAAGRSYGRSLSASGGVDIRV
jgi:flagellar hook-length control protein FliK